MGAGVMGEKAVWEHLRKNSLGKWRDVVECCLHMSTLSVRVGEKNRQLENYLLQLENAKRVRKRCVRRVQK